MICLDFYGLPGSGKSTISHLVAEKLREDLHVKEVSYDIDHGCSKWIRGLIKFKELIIIMVAHPCIFMKLIKVIADFHCIWNNKFYRNLLNLAFKVRALQHTDFDIVIFDQGLWQSVTSLKYGCCEDVDIISAYKKICSLINRNVYVLNVYIKVDVKIAERRLLSRESGRARVEKLNDDERLVELELEANIFDQYPQHHIIADGHMEKDTCCDYLIKQMHEIIYCS